MKLWVDDVRPAPEGYLWCRTADFAKSIIQVAEWGVSTNQLPIGIELIDIDHDAGDYAKYGGDYIRLLDWLEETGRSYPIRIHSANPVGVQNMRAIIHKNGWKEVF